MAKGKKLSNKVAPLYLTHVSALNKGYARANHKEAADRKLSILTGWCVCGRSAEPGFLTWDGMEWDDLHGYPATESYQSKPSKIKWVLFLPGSHRHADWALALGDVLVLDHGMYEYTEGEVNSLLPGLGTGSSAGNKLNSYVQALQPEGKPGSVRKYTDIKGCTVHNLPPSPTAAGLRPGAADTLIMQVPAEIAVNNTGHDLTDQSALWEYLGGRLSLLVPGAIALAGWPERPHGRLTGKGPVYPSLDALLGVSLECLERFMDVLFSFAEMGAKHPPMLLRGGALRRMVYDVTATLIMYYPERYDDDEMSLVLHRMRESYRSIGTPSEDPHFVLKEWAVSIKRQFEIDNLHLTSSDRFEGIEKVTCAVKQVGAAVATTGTQMGDLADRQGRLEQKLDAILAALAALPSALKNAASTTTNENTPSTPAATSIPPSPEMPPPPPAPSTPSAPVALHFASASSTIFSSGSSKQAEPTIYKTADLGAARFLLDCHTNGFKLPGALQRDGRVQPSAQKILDSILFMASPAQEELLKNSVVERSQVQTIIRELLMSLLNYIAHSYRLIGHPVPPRLHKGQTVFNTLIDNLRKSKAIISRGTISAWKNSTSSQGTSVYEPSAGSSAYAPIVGEKRNSTSPSEKRNSTSPRLAGKKPKNYAGDDSDSDEDDRSEEEAPASESAPTSESAPASMLAPTEGSTPQRPLLCDK